MPIKPDRPLMAATFAQSALEVEKFPAEQEQLESSWAQRFAAALEKQKGIRYEVAGRAPNPGDVLLRRAGESDIQLQVTEAVDRQRIQSDARRKSYLKAIAEAFPALKSTYSGIQIALIDGGQMLKLPDPKSAAGRAAAVGISRVLMALAPHLSAIPVFPPGCVPHFQREIPFREPSSGVEIRMFLTRYAPIDAALTAQWQWSGPAWSIGDVAPHYFLDAIKNKLDGNFVKIRDPLWLLAYTVDCAYDCDQEADVQSYLATARNPFYRIYILDRSRTRQVWPAIDDPETAPGKKGFTILGSDGIPKVNDPRYQDIA